MSLPYILTPEAKIPAEQRLRELIREGKLGKEKKLTAEAVSLVRQ